MLSVYHSYATYLEYRMDYNSDMQNFLYYTDNINPEQYTFTVIFMWNNANYIEICYTNIHT